MLQVIPSFYTNHSKNSVFISANTYGKHIVSNEYCIARDDDKMCSLPNCRHQILLIDDIKELLQKLDQFCFNCQHEDCGKNVAKPGQLFDNVQRAVLFNHQHRLVDRMPSIAEKRLLRKKYKNHLLSSFQKTKATQTSGSVPANRLEFV